MKIVPGVTAALAASAELGVSLTRRGKARSVAFVTPRVGEGDAREQLGPRRAGRRHRGDLHGRRRAAGRSRAQLIGAGKPPGDAGGGGRERLAAGHASVAYGTLARLPQWRAGRGGPALILVGEVYGEAASRRSRPSTVAGARMA